MVEPVLCNQITRTDLNGIVRMIIGISYFGLRIDSLSKYNNALFSKNEINH
ncbi:hypothetical protein [Virgibacillus salexigens]|uniref:hypothetical protein n=1 Tax=Virgibacillus salexigens TaxID=61016 RepID=UPI00040D5AB1|nr:hypothetical protein [Virgibacillus salexigens]